MPVVLVVVTLFVATIAFLADAGVRRSTRAAALLGLVYGLWLLAPRLLALHHLSPRTTEHWLIINAFFLIVFAAIGGAAGLVASLPLALYRAITRRPGSAWSDVIWPMAWLPVLYLAVSVLVEWSSFNRFALPLYSPETLLFLTVHGVVFAVLLITYLLAAATKKGDDGSSLMRVAMLMAFLGFVALAWRAPTVQYATRVAAPLIRNEAASARRPMLVIGVDAVSWRAITPLIEQGRMPTLARLQREGLSGDMLAAWPPYWSAPAWGAMLTGYAPEDTGVHEDLIARAPRLPDFELPLTFDPLFNPIYAVEYGLVNGGLIRPEPTPREALKRVPVWERLSKAGVNTAVVRFPFTYPARGQANYVVSNRLTNDLWDMIGVRVGDRGELVAPDAKADGWIARFESNIDQEPGLLDGIVTNVEWPQPADSSTNPIDVARRAVSVEKQMHGIALEIVKGDPSLSVLMLYIAGFDNIGHAYWQYRFPEDFPDDPPAPQDVAELGPVVDRYLERLDREIGQLMAAFPTRPDVIIVSDHGMTSGEATIWRGWHGARGVFLASGPGIPSGKTKQAVTYFDVVPTILHRLGFHVPPDLSGRSVLP